MKDYWGNKLKYKHDNQDKWAAIFKILTNRLLEIYESNQPGERVRLAKGVRNIIEKYPPNNKTVRPSNNPVNIDICPFTIMGAFNMFDLNNKATNDNRDIQRSKILKEIAELLGINNSQEINNFRFNTYEDGITTVYTPWPKFFELPGSAQNINGNSSDVDKLWKIFYTAMKYADEEIANKKNDVNTNQYRVKFNDDYNEARKVKWTGSINLTIGLYWINPYVFPSLDQHNLKYIKDPNRFLNSNDYPTIKKSIIDTEYENFVKGEVADGKEGENYLMIADELMKYCCNSGDDIDNLIQFTLKAYTPVSGK